MNIESISIDNKMFNFIKNNNLIYSHKNSKGKTTLVRFILYGLGYSIPSTSGIRFSKHIVKIIFNNDYGRIKFIRNDKLLIMNINDTSTRTIVLPNEFNEALSVIYNTNNVDLYHNILGMSYFDQEKGWTLLNRGIVIGKIRFNIEQVIQGLSNIDCSMELEDKQQITQKIKSLKSIKDILEMKNDYDNNPVSDWSSVDRIKDKIKSVDMSLRSIDNKLKNLNSIKTKNEKIVDEIDRMSITIKYNNESIPVNKENIEGFDNNQQILEAKINYLQSKKIPLIKDKSLLEKQLNENNNILGINDNERIYRFQEVVYDMNIDMSISAIDSLIKNERDKKDNLDDIIITKLKSTETSQDIYDVFYKFAEELDIGHLFKNKRKNYIFTKKVSIHSGAELHMLVFAFRLSLLKITQKFLNELIPIIIDSPATGELDVENLKIMFDFLKKEFPKNQIIIASIYDDYGEGFKKITLNNKLLY